jgi:DNA gyrase inhibitor GyrI
MNDRAVRIITLEPMRVASSYGFGTNPEEQAWLKLAAWAGAKGFLQDRAAHPIFGFNNPNPSPKNPRYGYEFWMKVAPEIEPDGDVRIIEFMGGTYAVTRCEAQGDPGKNMPAAWQNLIQWCKTNNHRFGSHQALENIISGLENPDELVVDLYCPVII